MMIPHTILLAQDAPGGAASPLIALLPWVLILGLFYLLLIRPERRKRAQLEQSLKQLKKNDRIVTAGGIFGTIVSAPQESDEITIRVDENTNTRLRILRNSVSRVVSADEKNSSGGT